MKGQMLLSYDMTFVVVLLTGLYELENRETLFTCPMHPTKKQTAFENGVTDYCSAINVMLAYHNLVDDWKDDKNYAKMTIASMIRKDYERFATQYPRQTKAIEEYMEKLAAYEKKGEENIDIVLLRQFFYQRGFPCISCAVDKINISEPVPQNIALDSDFHLRFFPLPLRLWLSLRFF